MKRTRLLIALAAALAGTAPAHAAIVDASSPLNFDWSYDTGSSTLTGQGSIAVSGFNTGTLTLGVTLHNSSLVGGQGGERLVAFAFGIDPDATSIGFVDQADGGMIGAAWVGGGVFNAQLPGVEVCSIGGQNCSGGGNGGIFAGASDTFSILLGGQWGDSVNIDPVGLRFQTGYGAFVFGAKLPPGGSGRDGSAGGSVPEPNGLALLGLGLLGVAGTRRVSRTARAARAVPTSR